MDEGLYAPPPPQQPGMYSPLWLPPEKNYMLFILGSCGLAVIFSVLIGMLLHSIFQCRRNSNRRERLRTSAAARAERERHRRETADELPKDVYEALPTSVFIPAANQEDATCAICIMEYELQDQVLTLPCEHWFHKECVTMWFKLHSTCPTCRLSLKANVNVPEAAERQDTLQGASQQLSHINSIQTSAQTVAVEVMTESTSASEDTASGDSAAGVPRLGQTNPHLCIDIPRHNAMTL